MKEIKYILHAFLLLLAFIGVVICLKVIYSINKPGLERVLTDHIVTTPVISSKGKELFRSKCASCHDLLRPITGPALCEVESRGPWSERKNLYSWIKNPMGFMSTNEYTRNLKKAYGGVMMSAFPDLTNNDIDEIINYINSTCRPTLPKSR